MTRPLSPKFEQRLRWMETESRFAHSCPDLDQEFPASNQASQMMDVKEVAALVGIDAATIGVWIYRDLVPGIKSDGQGKRRLFDEPTVRHLKFMAELVLHLGVPSPKATIFAEALAIGNPVNTPHIRMESIDEDQA